MSGIIGFEDFRRNEDQTGLLAKMSAAIQTHPTDIVDLYSDEHISLGSVRLRKLPQVKQPAWNEDHTIGVVMTGEIFGYDASQKALRERGYSIEESDTAKFIACLYQEEGDKFVQVLNGAFAIAIWDSHKKKLILVNDRMGFEPLYYAQSNDRFLFASGVRGLLADPTLPRSVNLLAMAQFLTFEHILGNHTFLQDALLLPPASILTLTDQKFEIRNYWKLEFADNCSAQSELEYTEELILLLRQAISRQLPEHPAGVLLSGGLDSRVIFALLHEHPLSVPLYTFTMGSKDSDDVLYARELAKRLKTPHEFYELQPDYLMHHAENGIQITDGMENVIHMHTLANLTPQAEQATIIYKGFLGDALMGYFNFRDLHARYATEHIFQLFFKHYPIAFNPTIHPQLFLPDIQTQLNDSVLNAARDELVPPGTHNLPAELFFQFDLRQRQRRMTLNGMQLVRSQAIVRTPFYDNDLIDFMLRVPQGYRLDRYLIKQAFILAFPELAKIPYTETNYPLVPCRRELFMRMDYHIRWRLRSAGLKWISVPTKRHYARYDNWFRGVLRGWVEDILLSKRFLGRGYFNSDFISQLLQEHMAGQNHSQKLGLLISIELWLRKFID